jgi:hypothetical protein
MDEKQEESSLGDLSDRATLMARLGALMDVVKTKRTNFKKTNVDASSSTELIAALKYLVVAVHNNKSNQEIKIDLLEKHIFEGEKGTTAVETVKYDELVALPKYFHLAQLAYKKDTEELRSQLKEHGYELQTHLFNTNPGEVGHYTALNHEKKTLLISAKGTNSGADAMTNAVAVAMPHVCSPTCPFSGP